MSFLDPEIGVPDDDELCEPWGPHGEEETLVVDGFDYVDPLDLAEDND